MILVLQLRIAEVGLAKARSVATVDMLLADYDALSACCVFIKRPCWAALRLLVEKSEASDTHSTARTLTLKLVHVRGGVSGQTFTATIDHETIPVPLLSALAAAAPVE